MSKGRNVGNSLDSEAESLLSLRGTRCEQVDNMAETSLTVETVSDVCIQFITSYPVDLAVAHSHKQQMEQH